MGYGVPALCVAESDAVLRQSAQGACLKGIRASSHQCPVLQGNDQAEEDVQHEESDKRQRSL